MTDGGRPGPAAKGCTVCDGCASFSPGSDNERVCGKPRCGHREAEHAPCVRRQYQFTRDQVDGSNRCLSCGLDVVAHVAAEDAPCSRKQYQFPIDQVNHRCGECGLYPSTHVEAEDAPCSLAQEQFPTMPFMIVNGRCSDCGLGVGRHNRNPISSHERDTGEHNALVSSIHKLSLDQKEANAQVIALLEEKKTYSISKAPTVLAPTLHLPVVDIGVNPNLMSPYLCISPKPETFEGCPESGIFKDEEKETQRRIQEQLNWMIEGCGLGTCLAVFTPTTNVYGHIEVLQETIRLNGKLGDVCVFENVSPGGDKYVSMRVIIEVKRRLTRNGDGVYPEMRQLAAELGVYAGRYKRSCWGVLTDSVEWKFACCSSEVPGYFHHSAVLNMQDALRVMHYILWNDVAAPQANYVRIPGLPPAAGDPSPPGWGGGGEDGDNTSKGADGEGDGEEGGRDDVCHGGCSDGEQVPYDASESLEAIWARRQAQERMSDWRSCFRLMEDGKTYCFDDPESDEEGVCDAPVVMTPVSA